MRQRFFRVIEVTLECGHVSHLNTSRYRVGHATKAVIVGHYVRSGVYCFACTPVACCAIKEVGKVVRA